jgi:integrase
VAGVTVVTAQGLRGTHATLAEEAGTAPLAVAKSMGHTGHDVTERQYLAPGTTDRVRQRAAIDRLTESWGSDLEGTTPDAVH